MLHLFVLLAALMIMISTQSMCLHCQVLLPLKPEKDAMCFESDILAKLFDHLRLLLKKKTPRRITHGISGPQHAWWTTLTGPKNATLVWCFFPPTIPGHDLLHYFSPRRRISLLDDDGAELSLTHLLCFSPSPLLPCSSPPYASLTFSIGP